MGERAGVMAYIGTVFPNMSFHAQQPRSILVAHPRGPNLTEMWRVYFVDKEMRRRKPAIFSDGITCVTPGLVE